MYDVIIIGAGPSGIFAALELKKQNPKIKILMVEKGNSIDKRICPKRKTGQCIKCKTCNITTGFAGAGAYSDGKLSLSPDVGGNLSNYIGYDETKQLIKYVDDIYKHFGADEKIYGISDKDRINEIRKKAIQSNIKLVECPIRHLGTEEGYNIYTKIQNYLIEKLEVDIVFNTKVEDFIIENNTIKGINIESFSNSNLLSNCKSNNDKVYIKQKAKYKSIYGDKIICAVGREGAEWLKNICIKHDIETAVGKVDIGIRMETRNEIMEKINNTLYEGKMIYYTPTFDDKVRTFCSNPGGVVATEYYDNNLAVVNGHSYKAEHLKTSNTNLALLVSKEFTEPFNSPIEYGKYIAQLGNMLSGNKIIVQRYGDFKRGRRTTYERLIRNNIVPTLKDAVPGDLCLVLPYRIMKDIDEMIQALDNIASGIASDETLLYGVEVKFYSNIVKTNKNFETSIKNLFTIGDGAGITRGLMQASCNGVWVARNIIKD